MKKQCALVVVVFMGSIRMQAQEPVTEIIKQAIVKVIKAVDLKIQRLQNETIWLQNAQKTVENALSKAKLQEIGDWVQKQRDLYANYFDELQQVRGVIVYYHRVRDITQLQARLVREYRQTFDLIRRDDHFTVEEIRFMEQVYAGILQKSVENMGQVRNVITAFTVSMTDAERMSVINDAADAVEGNYMDLRQFNQQNASISILRARDAGEAVILKKLYGL